MTLGVMVVSISLLGIAVGLLFLSGISKIIGRAIIIKISGVFFVVFAVATAKSPSLASLIGFGFLQGMAASTPAGIGGGVIGDLFIPQERGRATSLYAFGNLMGLVLGPVIGGYLTGGKG
jgi:MFS family permease